MECRGVVYRQLPVAKFVIRVQELHACQGRNVAVVGFVVGGVSAAHQNGGGDGKAGGL